MSVSKNKSFCRDYVFLCFILIPKMIMLMHLDSQFDFNHSLKLFFTPILLYLLLFLFYNYLINNKLLLHIFLLIDLNKENNICAINFK